METQKRKFSLFLIGLISCFAIAIIGIIVDFIMDLDGKIAVISVICAFVVCAIFIIIDVIVRRIAEKKAQLPPDAGPQFNVPADQRFIRHSASDMQDDFAPLEAYADDPYDSLPGFEGADDSEAEALARMERMSPSAMLRKRAAEMRAAQEKAMFETDTDAFASDGFDAPQFNAEADAFAADGFDPAANAPVYDESGADYAEADYPADNGFAEQQEDYYDYSDAPVQDTYPAAEYDDFDDTAARSEDIQEDESYLLPEVSYASQPAEQPAPQRAAAPAAAPVQKNTAAMGAGQTLESFYEDMSDEDILYRDCVEVWAADAKPSVLRLMKLVEELDDKKAQVRFGRELEYVNAMIDRIYCFTQLEYVDELLELEEHNFATLVKECLKRFSPFFMEKKLGLLWKGLDVNVMTDKKWFIFALTQVIFNSVEFTPEGGKIAISAKKNGDYIDLMIDDSGKGVSSDELPCVFIAGYMGDDSPNEAGRRTGMGLFIAQSVLRKMGGDAFMESNYGKGARVTLRVPAIAPPAK